MSCAFGAALLISPAALTWKDFLSTAQHDLQRSGGGGGWDVLAAFLAVAAAALLLIELVGFGIRASTRSVGLAATVAIVPIMFRLYPLPASDVFYTNLLTQPWLPAETITLTTHQSMTGYVLESDQDWTEVLRAEDRTVVHYHTSQVSSRAMCQIAVVASERPLFPLINAQSELPPCVLPPPAQGSGGALHPHGVTGTAPCRTAVRRCE